MSPEAGGGMRRFAVVLNRNAKKVTKEVAEMSGELVPPEDLFLSASAEDSQEIARTIIGRGYETVFAGGGDGTVMHLINQLARYPLEKQPAVGILMLGTGNAMARMVSSGNLKGDLKTYIRSATREVVPISLVETEGTLCPFAGIGLDAEILNDYRITKEKLGGGKMKPVVQTLAGYFLAIFTRTLPARTVKAFKGQIPMVRAVVRRGEAVKLGPEGQVLRTHGPGDLLYEGPMTIALAGTVPYYGYGFRILPFATREPGKMNLRIGHMMAASILAQLPLIWKGEQPGGIQDWLVEEVELTTDVEVPFQIGGDAHGYRRSVVFSTIPNAVRLLRLL